MARLAYGNPAINGGRKKPSHLWLRQEIRNGIAEISRRRSDLVDARQHGDISFAVAALRPVFAVALVNKRPASVCGRRAGKVERRAERSV